MHTRADLYDIQSQNVPSPGEDRISCSSSMYDSLSIAFFKSYSCLNRPCYLDLFSLSQAEEEIDGGIFDQKFEI